MEAPVACGGGGEAATWAGEPLPLRQEAWPWMEDQTGDSTLQGELVGGRVGGGSCEQSAGQRVSTGLCLGHSASLGLSMVPGEQSCVPPVPSMS